MRVFSPKRGKTMGLSRADIEGIANKYYKDVCTFCIARCGSREDGIELAQAVFLLFIQKSDSLKQTNIKSWLITTANYKVKEYFRARAKECSFLNFEECADIADYRTTDEELVEDFEKLLNDTQKRIIDLLTEQEKIVFIKRYIEKKSIANVAAELNMTEGNVRVHSSRAKKKAKELISTSQLLIQVLLFKLS